MLHKGRRCFNSLYWKISKTLQDDSPALISLLYLRHISLKMKRLDYKPPHQHSRSLNLWWTSVMRSRPAADAWYCGWLWWSVHWAVEASLPGRPASACPSVCISICPGWTFISSKSFRSHLDWICHLPVDNEGCSYTDMCETGSEGCILVLLKCTLGGT